MVFDSSLAGPIGQVVEMSLLRVNLFPFAPLNLVRNWVLIHCII